MSQKIKLMDTHQKGQSFSPDRTEHYLTRLLQNPNQWVRINKLKRQVDSRNNTQERQMLMMQIESALNLMGIEFEKYKSFKIRVVV